MGKQQLDPATIKEVLDRLDHQDAIQEHTNDRLEQIIWILTGNESLGIEGVKPALKRIEEKTDNEIRELKKWRSSIQNYFEVLTGKPFRNFMILIVTGLICTVLYIKGGMALLVSWFVRLFSK